MTIYVGNLSFDAEVEDLQQLFATYGTVRKCSLPLDRDTGRKRGFAFVEMAEANDEDKAIADLPPGYRTVFVLHDVEGFEHEEVAALLGVSVGTSKSQLHKARLRLRDLINKGKPQRGS